MVDPGNHPVSSKVQTGYKAGFVAPDTERDMAYYDALPRQVREALDDAPWAISTQATYHYFRLHGIVNTLREIAATNDAFLAMFEMETGVPRPRTPLGKGMGTKRCRR